MKKTLTLLFLLFSCSLATAQQMDHWIARRTTDVMYHETGKIAGEIKQGQVIYGKLNSVQNEILLRRNRVTYRIYQKDFVSFSHLEKAARLIYTLKQKARNAEEEAERHEALAATYGIKNGELRNNYLHNVNYYKSIYGKKSAAKWQDMATKHQQKYGKLIDIMNDYKNNF